MRRILARIFKLVMLALFLALIVAGVWAAPRWDAIADIPNLPSSFEAKEMCSCLFVEGRDQDFCASFVRQSTIPSDRRVVDVEARTVTVEALRVEHRARFVSERAGCVLDTDP